MKIRTVIKPGKRGTKALVKEYGKQLVCVRYRYDYFEKKKYKTIELIITEDDWQPFPLHPDAGYGVSDAFNLRPIKYIFMGFATLSLCRKP